MLKIFSSQFILLLKVLPSAKDVKNSELYYNTKSVKIIDKDRVICHLTTWQCKLSYMQTANIIILGYQN